MIIYLSHSTSESKPKPIQQRKIFAAQTENSDGDQGRLCILKGHTPGHIYGGIECNKQCKSKFSSKMKYAEEKRDEIHKINEKKVE